MVDVPTNSFDPKFNQKTNCPRCGKPMKKGSFLCPKCRRKVPQFFQ